ncbi:mRNA-capping enzyme subunit alpha [Rhodotorula toruloides ATCC 204091]|uniref:mRNA guanylyltransferase n=1 Tax=Rhodotorula toruloides TaxID=5286 RepID=A0A0K3C7Z2_RHOTO|nr:mRNA-capping enzyme subunit alpha [Rhodotorula toruloides ATCC 204091]
MAESPKLPASYAYQDEPEPDSHFTLPATSYPPEHPQPDEANSAGDTNGSGLVSPRVQPADEPQPQPDSFPGSQPVSFDYDSLALLEKEDFWVCEKSDGVRVLVMIVATGFGQEVYLIDRKDQIYQVYWLTFPHQDGPEYNHSNTVLDGEFVIDVDPHTGAHIPRLLLFDLLVLDSENLMSRPLLKRYGRLQQFVVEPYKKHQKTLPPDVIAQQPFEVVCKKQELSYGIEAVFRDHVPSLMHGSDGLIFTSAEAPYTPGTDPKILKWKPPSENSIDFILQLKFPAIPDVPTEPDFCAKPVFMLLMNHGHEGNHFFDTMEVDDATWEEWKASGEQYDDRVVEVVWDKTRETWKFLRFRDDKFEGNYKSVVYSIIKSIQHGVEAEQLVAHAGRIRKAWKARAAAKAPPPPPPRAQHDPSHQHHAPHPHGHSNGSHLAPPPVQGAGGYGLKR